MRQGLKGICMFFSLSHWHYGINMFYSAENSNEQSKDLAKNVKLNRDAYLRDLASPVCSQLFQVLLFRKLRFLLVHLQYFVKSDYNYESKRIISA